MKPTLLMILVLAAVGCGRPAEDAGSRDAPGLKDAFAGAFLVGAALNEAQFSGVDTSGAAIVARHFNTITAENVLKWENVHPAPDSFAFEAADRFVAFGEAHGMHIVGHTLVWHNQTPRWVFEDADGRPLGREALLERLRDHIHTVVGRYRGRIDAWDVVNEALNEDGSLRRTPWLEIIGEDYLAHAFRFAHEADPDAALYYNDFSIENAPKRDGTVRLVGGLLEQGVPVHGIGIQEHVKMDWPTPARLDSAIAAFAALGVDVMVTELDVDVLPRAVFGQGANVEQRAEARAALDPYTAGLPDSVQQALARRYAELFEVYLNRRDVLGRVTFWGVDDADSWLNGWPVPGRTSHPLLFDHDGRPKPAYDAVVGVADDGS